MVGDYRILRYLARPPGLRRFIIPAADPRHADRRRPLRSVEGGKGMLLDKYLFLLYYFFIGVWGG
jgi:hypothetical protein